MQHAEQPDEKVKRWNHVLFTLKYLRWGGSYAVIIPKVVRELLQLRPGDTLLMRLHVPYFTVRRGEPDDLINLKTFRLEDYPPRWPTVGRYARAESAPEGATPGATEPHAGDDGPGSTE